MSFKLLLVKTSICWKLLLVGGNLPEKWNPSALTIFDPLASLEFLGPALDIRGKLVIVVLGVIDSSIISDTDFKANSLIPLRKALKFADPVAGPV